MSYHYYSKTTGEIVPRLRDVIRTAWKDLVHSHFLNIRWEYSKEGY